MQRIGLLAQPFKAFADGFGGADAPVGGAHFVEEERPVLLGDCSGQDLIVIDLPGSAQQPGTLRGRLFGLDFSGRLRDQVGIQPEFRGGLLELHQGRASGADPSGRSGFLEFPSPLKDGANLFFGVLSICRRILGHKSDLLIVLYATAKASASDFLAYESRTSGNARESLVMGMMEAE